MIPWHALTVDEARMARLKKAFDGCGSDKATHHYERVYQHFLSRTPEYLLEFGISNFTKEFERRSGSLFAWSELYPNCKILGVDRDPDRMFAEGNIRTVLADQENADSLEALSHTISPDVIIDDASHVFENSIRTFNALFPKLKPGGVYLIEDVAKKPNGWQQTVADWEAWGPISRDAIVDAWPENPNDVDSVIVCIRK